MERSTWTDERIDDKMRSIDRTFDRIGDEMAGLRDEMRGMRSDLARVQDRMIQIGFGLVVALLAALLTAILALV